MEKTMDRRQRKTREAIFSAFIELLAEKNVNKITVSDIIERADIGRATFYAHFETKDFLIKDMCDELFCHIFDNMNEHHSTHRHIFSCDACDSVFVHLLKHLEKNDNNILQLLSGCNNELFLSYFEQGLITLIKSQDDIYEHCTKMDIPQSFWTIHVASTFVEAIKWWINNKMELSVDEIATMFLRTINANQP